MNDPFEWPSNVIPIWTESGVWDAILSAYMKGISIKEIAHELRTHESFVAVVIKRKLSQKRDRH